MAQSAYLAIREGIIHGAYPPGSRLRERDLSQELRMSRIPIREALRQLEVEGFVATSPNRGAVVSQLTLKDVSRAVRPAPVARRYWPHDKPPKPSPTGVPTTRSDGSSPRRTEPPWPADTDAIRQSNTQFHAQTIAMTGNALLIATMAPLLGRIRWLFALTADRDPHVEYAEHVTLCDAIYSGNPDLAGALAFAHIEHGRAPSLAGLADVLPQS